MSKLTADRYPVLGTWYLDFSGSSTRDPIVQAFDTPTQDPYTAERNLRCLEIPEADRKSQLRLEFVHRAERDSQKARHLPRATPTGTFGDVGADRYRCAAKLRREPKALFLWKAGSESVNLFGQRHTFFPDFEAPVVMHLSLSTQPCDRFQVPGTRYQVRATRYEVRAG